jgi:hypothetical protein
MLLKTLMQATSTQAGRLTGQNQTRNPICRQEGRSADVHLGCFVVAKHCLPAHLDCGAEVLEDETIPGVSLEEWCEHQRLDSHELDQDVQGWP